MYNDDKGRRAMALSITHYVYRNTRLEDFHAECVHMDKNFYRIIYNTVRTKLKNVRDLQRYIDSFPKADLNNKDTLYELINSGSGRVTAQIHKICARYHVRFGFRNELGCRN